METITFAPSPEVACDLEWLMQRGRYRDLSEAMNKAIRLLVQREKAAQATAQILAIRRKLADWQVDLTQVVVASHEEET